VPQELAFHDDMQLDVAMEFFARLRGVPRSRCAERLERVGLSGHEQQRVRDLSGGMKQRLALAVALLADPPVIVLDEPTSNLDALGREGVLQTLEELRVEGKTIVFASHRREEVQALADRLLVLESGRLVRDTTPGSEWPRTVRMLRLRLVEGVEAAAAVLLRNSGLDVECNGRGLIVQVPEDRKGEAISLLAESRIRVRDFEIFDGPEGVQR
jgi:ABC-type multidrug transport system ATPase subunit